jgi:hypothetical protein
MVSPASGTARRTPDFRHVSPKGNRYVAQKLAEVLGGKSGS